MQEMVGGGRNVIKLDCTQFGGMEKKPQTLDYSLRYTLICRDSKLFFLKSPSAEIWEASGQHRCGICLTENFVDHLKQLLSFII